MTSAAKLADGLDSKDPRVGLRAVSALRRLLEELEAIHVTNARSQGWAWQDIAGEVGVSRQAVHKKHAARRGLLRRD